MLNYAEAFENLKVILVNGKPRTPTFEEVQTFMEAVPIVLMPSGEVDQPVNWYDHEEGVLDLPFKTVYLEMMNGSISQWHEPEKEGFLSIVGILVTEVDVGKYEYIISMRDVQAGKLGRILNHIIKTSNASHAKTIDAQIFGMVRELISRINSEKVGHSSPRINLKLKTGNAKYTHRIKNVVYISPKSHYEEADSGTHKEINWTHRFMVRGHWRKIAGLGKDRAGDYTVKGYTWVIPFVKGPEDAPLVKKSYVVKEGLTDPEG